MVNKETKHLDPLVSICVITYNSSNYILETLESAKNQTYKNIELIISDDASKDNTLSICRNWLIENEVFFVSTKVLSVNKNTGISGNCNRGLVASKGKWFKLIAGDDILLNNCIEFNVNYTKSNPTSNFLFSRPIFFGNNGGGGYEKINSDFKAIDNFYSLTAENQFLHLLIKNYPMSPPTMFCNREALNQLGGYDERFPNEDFPLYLKVTEAGHKLDYISKQTVKYRFHDQSISFRKNDEAVNFWKRLKFRKTIRQYISWFLFKKHPFIVVDFYNQFIINELVIVFGNTQQINNILKPLRLLSPLYLLEKLRFNISS